VTLADAFTALVDLWGGGSPLEAAGALLGVVYVVLVIGQHRLCWLAAFLSTALYLEVFYAAGLYMQAALQVYYLLVAVYGWRAWRRDAGGAELAVSRASWRVQLAGVAAVLVASAATSAWLARETQAPQPVLDSLTTWGSVFATWLVARKKIDNWPWWLVIDALIAILCWQQKLYASMILYLAYLGLVVIGWRSWQTDMRRARAAA
jgi:nicotinamide mononucleotide transporter